MDPKTHMCPCLYTKYQVLITMYPRNIANTTKNGGKAIYLCQRTASISFRNVLRSIFANTIYFSFPSFGSPFFPFCLHSLFSFNYLSQFDLYSYLLCSFFGLAWFRFSVLQCIQVAGEVNSESHKNLTQKLQGSWSTRDGDIILSIFTPGVHLG